MERCEELILRFFLEKNKVKEGSVCPVALIEKEKGIGLEELNKAARSLELQGLVKIKSLKQGEIGGDSETILGFWIELTLVGEDVIKNNL